MSLNLQDMMAKVQELQSRMSDAQEKLREIETTVEVGGGMVSVTMNGKQEARKIKIEKSGSLPTTSNCWRT